MNPVYLSLGSNVGDRLSYITQALSKLAKAGVVAEISSVYETPPWGKEDQRAFLNACVELRTNLSTDNLLTKLKQIESDLGRQERERWGPREIDIDILFYGDEQINEQRLTIPHPLLHERAFVLVPLTEIAADFIHPVMNKTVKDLLASVDAKGIELFGGATE